VDLGLAFPSESVLSFFSVDDETAFDELRPCFVRAFVDNMWIKLSNLWDRGDSGEWATLECLLDCRVFEKMCF
jgi:hypothetical protein